jgi:2-keto-4-pentenoate hydratase
MTGITSPRSLTSRLLEARRSGTAFAVAPEDRPQTEPSAYAVQHAVAATLGPIGGWKVGAGGPNERPSAAPLPASVIVAAPARLSSQYSDRLVEAEIAFRIARDLPPRETAYTRAEVLAAIGSCNPVVEVVRWRIEDWRPAPAILKLADNLGHGGLVVGEPKADWQAIDFTTLEVTQEIAGQAAKRLGGRLKGRPDRDLRIMDRDHRGCGGSAHRRHLRRVCPGDPELPGLLGSTLLFKVPPSSPPHEGLFRTGENGNGDSKRCGFGRIHDRR